MINRTPADLKYLSSRNAFIRMTSSVNVGDDKGALANQYILQGGTLTSFLNKEFYKQGVGDNTFNAYSKVSPSGKDNFLGIRPMPGITSIDVKSKSAYGSLREVIVNFQCWDIKQLEDLELLYMRPGYTVLVEWGWSPYLKNNGELEIIPPQPYDILKKGATERQKIFKELFEKSKKLGGNYEAMFGYVKNYKWSARADGGYDCQTIVISTGELIESLKVNFVRPDLVSFKMYDSTSIGSGYLDSEFTPQGTTPSTQFAQHYEKNTLAGMWFELYRKLAEPVIPSAKFTTTGIFNDVMTHRGLTDKNNLWYFNTKLKLSDKSDILDGINNIWITLDVAFEFINRYIIANSINAGNTSESLIQLSLDASTITSDGSQLLCIAHPLQVSVDPSVCIIKSPLWFDKGNSQNVLTSTSTNTNIQATQQLGDTIFAEIKKAAESGFGGINRNNDLWKSSFDKITSPEMFEYIDNKLKDSTNKLYYSDGINGLLKDYYDKSFGIIVVDDNSKAGLYIINHLKTITGVVATFDWNSYTGSVTVSVIFTPPANVNSTMAVATNVNQAINAISTFDNMSLDFFTPDVYAEKGIIKNIYVNLDFLYKQSVSAIIESQDRKEKNEINLYRYLKGIISAIQTSLGNVNTFEIHVDPIDNKARVIDINYTGEKGNKLDLFELQLRTLNSVVRSYKLDSQIFPEQGAIIAIGAQAKGGQMGIQSNTMIDFNQNITDRIIPEKYLPQNNSYNASTTNAMAASLASITRLFAAFNPPTGTNNDANAALNASGKLEALYYSAKNSLRDLIVYFQSSNKSSGSNRNLIPVKFSFEMDGIGGLVIGHLFKIPDHVLPKGYKGAGVGNRLAQTITGISHKVDNGDWTTTIDALNFVLSDKTNSFKDVDIKSIIDDAYKATSTGATGGGAFGVCPDRTNRTAFPADTYKNQATVFSSLNETDVAAYINSQNTYSLSVKRSTFASFGVETGWGRSVINNNCNGMQSDGGGWFLQNKYINGVTNFQEGKTGICRSFATYPAWQKCMDHVLLIMNLRTQGNTLGQKEVTPTKPDDADFWAKNYAANWIGTTDANAIATNKSVYKRAMTFIK